MVTGIETAGLILGSLPLLISAIESYAEGVHTIQKWWRYERELASLKRILDAEYIRFLNTSEELLSGIVSDHTLADLLDDPGGVAWRDPEIERKLRIRLRKAFASYLETIADMKAVTSSLKEKLELDPEGKFRWADSRTFKREYKRIKFSLTKSSYDELMKRLEKGNDTLANLTGQSLRLEPMRLRRNNRITDFAQVRTQAESLYRGLKLNWRCGCKIPHTAILRLEARTSDTAEDPESKRVRFRMVFSFDGQEIPQNSFPWKSKETDIELVKEEEGFPEQFSWSASTSPLTSTSSLTLGRPRRAVRWASDNSQGSFTTALAMRSSISKHTSMVQIRNLCSAFKDCTGTEACLGFLMDEKQTRHGIYPVLQPLHQEPPTAITLYKRLSGSSQNRTTKLSRKERLKVSLILASSVLQLHKTPWLNERWGKSDIIFLEGNNGPFISRSFLPTSAVPAPDSAAQTKPIPLVRNETIFALGVILIEICLGQPLESMRQSEDLGEDGLPNSITDYMTARRLVSDVYDEGGGRYGDAVRRCIHCEFDQRTASLDVESFRQSFYHGVIQPLEDDWMDFNTSRLSPYEKT